MYSLSIKLPPLNLQYGLNRADNPRTLKENNYGEQNYQSISNPRVRIDGRACHRGGHKSQNDKENARSVEKHHARIMPANRSAHQKLSLIHI